MSDDFKKMFEESFAKVSKNLNVGDKIQAEILSINKEEVFVSTGTMYDGYVQKNELLDEHGIFNYKTGDQVLLYVTAVKASDIRLSPKPTAKNLSEDLEDAFDMMLAVEGRVTEVNKGGYTVTVLGKNAFCPFSQIDIKKTDDPNTHLNQKYEFLITRFEDGGRKVVLSRRKLLEEKQGLEQETLIQEKKPGDTINGKVVKLEKYGAFIEVAAGIEGLVHISEISHQRIADPAEVLSVGQMVSAKIISIGTETGRLRISLSLKNAEEDPWNNLESKLKVGSTVDAQITQLTRFGAFASAGGVEGLIPLSEISSEKRVTNPGDLLQIGQKVRVLVQEIKMDQKRISFSMKDAAGDSEWKQFEPSTQKGLGTLAEQFNKLKMEAKPKAKL